MGKYTDDDSKPAMDQGSETFYTIPWNSKKDGAEIQWTPPKGEIFIRTLTLNNWHRTGIYASSYDEAIEKGEKWYMKSSIGDI